MADSESLRTWQGLCLWALSGAMFYVIIWWFPALSKSELISLTMRGFLLMGFILIIFYSDYILRHWYTEPDEKPGFLRDTAQNARGGFLILFFIFAFKFFIGIEGIIGDGMVPAIYNQEYVLSNSLHYLFSSPARGDILIVATGDGNRFCRIAALPGDILEIKDKVILVNGKTVEPWMAVSQPDLLPWASVTLSNDQFGVFADNIQESNFCDEPVIYRSDIIGKIFFRLKPFSKMGFISNIPMQQTIPGIRQDNELKY